MIEPVIGRNCTLEQLPEEPPVTRSIGVDEDGRPMGTHYEWVQKKHYDKLLEYTQSLQAKLNAAARVAGGVAAIPSADEVTAKEQSAAPSVTRS